MKKLLATLAVCSSFALTGTAGAVDSTGGCGLGSMAWRGQSGIIPQSLAMTTNHWFSNTIGVTLGTSGCDPNGRITGGTGRMMLAFLQDNMEQFAMDAAAGKGQTRHDGAAHRPHLHHPLRNGLHGQSFALCRSGELQLHAVDAPPQRRSRTFYRGANGMAAARQGSHRRVSLH